MNKYTYNYVNTNQLSEQIYFNWNGTTSSYDSAYKSIYLYDAAKYVKEIKVLQYNSNLSQWQNYSNVNFWYVSTYPASINNQMLATKWSMYPNPIANDRFTIETEKEAQYSISDMQGKQLQQGKLSKGTNAMQLQNVATGTYILQVNGKAQLMQKQ